MAFLLRPLGILMLLIAGLRGIAMAADGDPVGSGVVEPPRKTTDTLNVSAPSIEQVLSQLESLQPIPFDHLWRTPPAQVPQDRSRLALLSGALLADGFLVVVAQRESKIDPLGRTIFRLAKAIGIGPRLTKRGLRMAEMAENERWAEVRRELSRTQSEAEAGLIALHDDDLVHLIGLGGWMRGLEITTATVSESYSPERARRIVKPELAQYFLEQIRAFPPKLRATPLMQVLEKNVHAIYELAPNRPNDRALTLNEINRLRELSRECDRLIYGEK